MFRVIEEVRQDRQRRGNVSAGKRESQPILQDEKSEKLTEGQVLESESSRRETVSDTLLPNESRPGWMKRQSTWS
jgi:hypothetical protein